MFVESGALQQWGEKMLEGLMRVWVIRVKVPYDFMWTFASFLLRPEDDGLEGIPLAFAYTDLPMYVGWTLTQDEGLVWEHKRFSCNYKHFINYPVITGFYWAFDICQGMP